MKHNISLLANGMLWLVFLALFLFMYIKERTRKQSQNKLIESLPQDDCLNWFRVKVSRPAFFHRKLKLLGYEGRALLINTADKLRVVAEFGKGEVFDRSYPKDDLNLQWIGNPGLASANMHWISIGNHDDLLMITSDTGFNAVPSRETTADMCRMIVPGFQLPAIATGDFALEKNRASLLLIAMFFLLLAYAFLDGVVFNDHELINFDRIIWLLPALIVCAIPAYFFLVRGKVPSRESLALSMLFVVGIELAFTPFIKRVDQLLAANDTQTYEYKLTADAHFEPVQYGPPKLNFSHVQEYWAQYDTDSIQRFDLLHGPLGLWQLNHATLDPKFRAFYEQRDKGK